MLTLNLLKFAGSLKSPPWLLLLASLMTACGDSHVKGPTVNYPDFEWTPSNEPTEVVSVGPISALPKANVNGVTYNTAAANVTLNGTTGVFTDLKIGHIVTIDGRLNQGRATGNADHIEFKANVLGPIEHIDTWLQRIVVMGQSVLFDSNTTFDHGIDPISLVGLNLGSVARISGFTTAGGEIVATRIEPAPSNSGFQVIGAVSGLDLGNFTFQINGLVVDYSSAVIIDLPGGMPADAMKVAVRGSLATDGRFVVEQISDIAPGANIAVGIHMEISGYISSYQSDTNFQVSGFPVTTDFHTTFYSGMRDDLSLGAKVEIHGQRTSSGAIVADQIGFGSLPTFLTFDFKD